MQNNKNRIVIELLAILASWRFNCIYSRIHQMIRVTPAIRAGLTDHVWVVKELVAIIG